MHFLSHLLLYPHSFASNPACLSFPSSVCFFRVIHLCNTCSSTVTHQLFGFTDWRIHLILSVTCIGSFMLPLPLFFTSFLVCCCLHYYHNSSRLFVTTTVVRIESYGAIVDAIYSKYMTNQQLSLSLAHYLACMSNQDARKTRVHEILWLYRYI